MSKNSGWLFDIVVGGFVGGIVGGIVAVNTIIFFGIGYDVTIAEVFRQSFVAGVITVTLLIAGPIGGVVAMRRRRRSASRTRSQATPRSLPRT